MNIKITFEDKEYVLTPLIKWRKLPNGERELTQFCRADDGEQLWLPVQEMEE